MHTFAFWHTTVGKKVVMAVTGLIMTLFLVAHLAGNLLVFAGAAQIDAYAAFLQRELVPLWVVRIVLIASVVLHIAAAYQLAIASRGARRVRYAELEPQAATIASRTMRIGGVAIAGFIVFHLLHLTTGTIRPAPFSPAHVYANLVGGFRVWWVVAIYLVALVAIGVHLYHGAWGWPRTLGFSRPKPEPRYRPIATVVSIALWAGFTAIPVAIVARLVG
jgi:succinate dehydrogenase / fumarate reductase cytochrome b subunit